MGRPTTFTPEIQELVLELLLSGESLSAICRLDAVPISEGTVRRWAQDDEDFSTRYAHARSIGYDIRAEAAVEETKTLAAKMNPQAARLAFDAERWYLGKMKPKVYGDKIDVTSAGEKLEAPQTTVLVDNRVQSLIAIANEAKRADVIKQELMGDD